MMFPSFFSWDMGEFDEYNHWEFLFYQSNFIAIILPDGRADFPASALLRGIRSEGPRLHSSHLSSAAISTRE